jgi:hypothetical protein
MTLGGPSGPSGSPLRPAPTGGTIRQFLEQGPLEGRVTADLGAGGLRVATALGLLTVTEAALPFLPGDPVRLRLDLRTGRIRAEPPVPTPGQPPGAATDEAAASPAQPALLPRNPALASAVLASLQPLVPGHGAAGAAPPIGLPPDSPAFAFLAALFPEAMPNQRLSRALRPLPRRRAHRAYHPDATEDAPIPEQPEPEPPPEPERPEILDAAEIADLRWQPPPEDPDPVLEGELTEDEPGSRAGLEITLTDGARLQFAAELRKDRVRLVLRSDHPLPEGLAARLRARAEPLAQARGLPLDLALDGPPT